MTRLVVTSDWHADTITCGTNRFDDIERAAVEVVEYVRRERADGFVFLGDLSDPDNVRSVRATALAVQVAVGLKESGIPNLWLSGNHDVIEDGFGTTTISALRHLHPFTSAIERPQFGAVAGLNAYFVAYPFVARHQSYDEVEFTADALEDYDSHGKGLPVVVLSHLSLSGAKTGSESTTLSRGRDHGLPTEQISQAFPRALVLQGHYHKPQTISASGLNIHIPGSLERLRFDEETDKCGWLLVEY